MTALDDIRVALENHLATMTYSPTLPPVAWPNVPFTPPANATHIRAIFMPVTRRPVVVGPDPEQRRSGVFMVTVYSPEETGAAECTRLAEAIEDRFNGSTAIVAADVTVRLDYSEAKRPLQSTPFFAIPVEIGWHAFT